MEEETKTIEEQPKKKGSSKGIIIGLVTVIIILIGVIATLLIKPDIFKANTKSNDNSKSNQQETKKKDSKKETEETKESDTVKELDPTKSLNTSGYTYSDISDKDEDLGITIKINDDKRSVTVTTDGKANKTISNVTQSTSTDQPIDRVINGFSKNIKSAYVNGLGQDVTGTVLFFITEDDTVQFVKLFNQETDANGNTYYVTYWAHGDNPTILNVDNVNGIVKLYGANASAPMSSGFHTTLAATKDGSFYDLSQIIK